MANTLLLMEENLVGHPRQSRLGLHTSTAQRPRVNPLAGNWIQNAAAWSKKKKHPGKSRNQLPCPDCHGVLEFQLPQKPGLAERSREAGNRNGYLKKASENHQANQQNWVRGKVAMYKLPQRRHFPGGPVDPALLLQGIQSLVGY